jgi:multiple sugar transport system permease protein/N,N'-diacetylchitobiose transport system permease protein
VVLYAAVLAVGAFSLFPFAWMALTSIKKNSEIFTRKPVFVPSTPTLDRYAQIFADSDFTRPLLNSTIVAGTTTVLGIAVAALAGYALARFRMPLQRYLLVLVLSVQMFPLIALIIPLFVVMRTLDLLNTYTGLILAYLSFTIPLAVWMLRGFFRSIPSDLEDAAMVDGCTRMGSLLRIVLPLAGPGIAAASIYGFISAWNEFLFALTFMSDERMYTLPVMLQSFVGREQSDWGAIMAASVLFTLPVIVFFLLVHKRLTQGMVQGGIKG